MHELLLGREIRVPRAKHRLRFLEADRGLSKSPEGDDGTYDYVSQKPTMPTNGLTNGYSFRGEDGRYAIAIPLSLVQLGIRNRCFAEVGHIALNGLRNGRLVGMIVVGEHTVVEVAQADMVADGEAMELAGGSSVVGWANNSKTSRGSDRSKEPCSRRQ